MIKKMPEQISNICVKWQVDSPFFAEFLLRFTYREEHEFTPTAGVAPVDNKILFFYNEEYLKSLTLEQIEGLCAHEIMHILNKFHDRVGSRDKEIFNVAQDACINESVEDTTINDRKLQLPPNGVKIQDIIKMGYSGEHISEKIYDFLEKNATKIYIVSSGGQGGDGEGECPVCGGGGEENEPQDQQSSGQGGGNGNESEQENEGEGSGEGGSEKQKDGKQSKGGSGGKKKPHDPNCPLCGKNKGKKIVLRTTDDHRQHKPLTDVEKVMIQDIVDNAKTRSWGKLSGNMVGVIKELIKTIPIPWQRKLAALMSKTVSEPGSVYENTWARRNRRGLPLPGIRKLSKKIVVTVDTSGSIGDDDIMKFFGQVERIVKDYSSMTIVQWDTEVKSVAPYKRGAWRKIKILGRGGTDPQLLYTHIHENLKHTSLIVNFTDGYFDWSHIDHYNIPTIWAVVNNDEIKPTFGDLVLIKPSNPNQPRRNRW